MHIATYMRFHVDANYRYWKTRKFFFAGYRGFCVVSFGGGGEKMNTKKIFTIHDNL